MAEKHERRFLKKTERHISPDEITSYNQEVLLQNALKGTLQKEVTEKQRQNLLARGQNN